MIVCEEKFKKGDYIINRKCGDMGINEKLYTYLCSDKRK